MTSAPSPTAGDDRWLLPDGVEELLPADAARLEALRRRLLDLFRCWGYELIVPPLIEYTESLLIGLGKDVDLQTFKFTDQLSGRMLGIRPDITPQAARIDAHSLRRDGPVRLCYAGSVLHTRPRTPFASRSPIQLGAEFYGEAGSAADVEVVCLMLGTLRAAGIAGITLDLGHVGIFRALMDRLQLDDDCRAALFDALQDKAAAQIDAILATTALPAGQRNILSRLAGLNGDAAVLAEARGLLAGFDPRIDAALAALDDVAAAVAARVPGVTLHFDLCELHGYHYHSGLVFAAYVSGQGEAIANGGRYDEIGRVFGRARPATGFNVDLKALLALQAAQAEPATGIFVAHELAGRAWCEIERLRAAGERVVVGMPGQQGSSCCDRALGAEGNGFGIQKQV